MLDARDRLTATDSPIDLSIVDEKLTTTELHLGHLDEALARARSASSVAADKRQSPHQRASVAITLGRILLAQGDRDGASEVCADAEWFLADARVNHDTTMAWNRLAALYEQAGDITGALRAYRNALTTAGYPPPAAASPVVTCQPGPAGGLSTDR